MLFLSVAMIQNY